MFLNKLIIQFFYTNNPIASAIQLITFCVVDISIFQINFLFWKWQFNKICMTHVKKAFRKKILKFLDFQLFYCNSNWMELCRLYQNWEFFKLSWSLISYFIRLDCPSISILVQRFVTIKMRKFISEAWCHCCKQICRK